MVTGTIDQYRANAVRVPETGYLTGTTNANGEVLTNINIAEKVIFLALVYTENEDRLDATVSAYLGTTYLFKVRDRATGTNFASQNVKYCYFAI